MDCVWHACMTFQVLNIEFPTMWKFLFFLYSTRTWTGYKILTLLESEKFEKLTKSFRQEVWWRILQNGFQARDCSCKSVAEWTRRGRPDRTQKSLWLPLAVAQISQGRQSLYGSMPVLRQRRYQQKCWSQTIKSSFKCFSKAPSHIASFTGKNCQVVVGANHSQPVGRTLYYTCKCISTKVSAHLHD